MLVITVQFNAPINVEIEVPEDFDHKLLLDNLWNDFKNPDSRNSWSASPGDIKEVIREAWICEDDLNFIAERCFAVLE
jgi:hypothetical protein